MLMGAAHSGLGWHVKVYDPHPLSQWNECFD